MAYISKQPLPEENQPDVAFIQNDKAMADEASGYVSKQPLPMETLGEVAKQATKAALFPLMAPAEPLADVLAEPPGPDPLIELNERAKREGYVSLEQAPYYPGPAYTSLAPTIDAFSAPFIAKDVATLGMKGMKGIASAFSKTDAAKKAFIAESDKIAKLPGQMLLPMEDVARTRAPRIDARNAPLMEEDIAGATTRDVTATAPKMTSPLPDAPVTPKIEAFPKGSMGGGTNPNTGQPLPKVTIWGVRGDPDEIAKLGFGPDPASIPETIIKQKGIPIAGEVPPKPPLVVGRDLAPELPLSQEIKTNAEMMVNQPPLSQPRPLNPNAIQLSTTDIKDINKKAGTSLPETIPNERVGLGKVKKGVPTKPFEVPEVDILSPGGKARIANLTSAGGTDLAKTHSTSTSAEMVTDVGSAGKTVRDQLQTGLKGEAEAERKANIVFTDIKNKYKIEPDSLDSTVLSKYMRNPNKQAAAQDLRMRLGDQEANKFINAERDIRQHFDRWRNEVNSVRRANGMREIPYKEDYLPQIHEYNTLSMLGTPELAGTEKGAEVMKSIQTDADVVKANQFRHLDEIAFRHLLKQSTPDVDDAIKGLEMYGREAERFKVLQPHINELRQSAEAVKDTMPNLAKAYVERADHIAGKAEGVDEWLRGKIGKDAFNFYVEASNRMKKNVIQGNPNIPFSQLLVLPSLSASLPMKESVVASIKLATQPEFRRFLIANSPTLQLRLEGSTAQAMHTGAISKGLSLPSELVDQTTLLYALGAKFQEGVKAGLSVKEAMAEAEQFASLTQATLSKLSTAPILRSKTVQSGAPFLNQVLSQTKYITKQMFRNKPMSEKASTAAKYMATALAVATVNTMFLGDKAKTGFESSQIIPFGGAAEQGLGGPVVQSVGRFSKAEGIEKKLLQVFRTAMLVQNKLPAGLQISKGVEAFFSKPKETEE